MAKKIILFKEIGILEMKILPLGRIFFALKIFLRQIYVPTH